MFTRHRRCVGLLLYRNCDPLIILMLACQCFVPNHWRLLIARHRSNYVEDQLQVFIHKLKLFACSYKQACWYLIRQIRLYIYLSLDCIPIFMNVVIKCFKKSYYLTSPVSKKYFTIIEITGGKRWFKNLF